MEFSKGQIYLSTSVNDHWPNIDFSQICKLEVSSKILEVRSNSLATKLAIMYAVEFIVQKIFFSFLT